jgi:hypothetical protein
MRLIDIKDLPKARSKKPKYVSNVEKAMEVCGSGKAVKLGKSAQTVSMKKSLVYVQAKDPKATAYKILSRGGSVWLVCE